jgi:hypothetical protein
MRSEDRLSVIGIIIGLAWGAASAALPLAFPAAPVWVWQVLFWFGAIVLAASTIFLTYELAIRPRGPAGKKMDPLLWLSATALLIGIVALGAYIAKAPATVSSADAKQTSPPQVVAKTTGLIAPSCRTAKKSDLVTFCTTWLRCSREAKTLRTNSLSLLMCEAA